MNENFEAHQVHLRMMECNATTCLALAFSLEEELRKHKLLSKIIACVKDGGSNLSVCTFTIRSVATYDIIGLDYCFNGTCFVHVLSGACNSALSSDICEDLSEDDITRTKSALQKCVTWIKKSGKGQEDWYKSCREMKKKERMMPTPVKTRFVSTVVMLSMMLEYRDVVEHCFSKQPDLKLRGRVPSMRVWEIARVVGKALEPVMHTCIRVQKNKDLFLSDAVACFCKLYLQYKRMSSEPAASITPEGASFETQLHICQRKIAKAVPRKLSVIVAPMLEFTGLTDRYVHHYLSFALDPEFKNLRNPYMKLHTDDLQLGRDLAKKYDQKVLLPMLVKLKDPALIVSNAKIIGQGQVTNNTGEAGTDASRTPGETGMMDEEESIDCFVLEQNERKLERDKRALASELSSFRSEEYNPLVHKKCTWLFSKREKFPTVTLLARHILGIPATQIDKERFFSRAGLIASPRRNNIATTQIDNLVSIEHNHPDCHITNLNMRDVSKMEEFSDFLVAIETSEDKNENRNEKHD